MSRKGCVAAPAISSQAQFRNTLKGMALTAGHFSWKKVTKNRLLLHPALRCALCLFTSGSMVWLAGLRPAICIGSTGLFAGQVGSPHRRSYRDCAEFKICANPVGAGLSREEARIPTTHATIKNTASPDATRNFATSGGRMQEQAVFGYFFPRKKVTRRKGGRGHYSHYIKWISPQSLSQPASQPSQ
ncbi:hypothetical protein J3B00_000895 [Pseudomonas sp. BP8]|nr:hypothetical protein [Pseudomonas sp. BP8]